MFKLAQELRNKNINKIHQEPKQNITIFSMECVYVMNVVQECLVLQ